VNSDVTHVEQAISSSGIGVPGAEVATGRSDAAPQSLLAYPATYGLLCVNLFIFFLMLWFGSGPLLESAHRHAWSHLLTASFDDRTLLRFGASDSNLVLFQGEWWRLLTSMFVHVTVLHIALNMWCLWNLGLFGEPLLGKQGLVWVYLLTGAAGMLLSLLWAIIRHGEIETAGASGAIFGIAGILIVLLSNRKLSLPWNELRDLRRQVIFFAVANLAIGIGPDLAARLSSNLPRIDNSAHIGGFVCGLALGVPLLPRMTSGRSSYRARQRWTFLTAALVLCLVAYAIRVGAR
jgi:rhomboid protease GluP